jgi:hypothetical protein
MATQSKGSEGVTLHTFSNVFDDDHFAGITIECRSNRTVSLKIPRSGKYIDDQKETYREMLECLQTQITNLLAVEALEGR